MHPVQRSRLSLHQLHEQMHIPPSDRTFLTRACLIAAIDGDTNSPDLESPNPDSSEDHMPDLPTSCRVQIWPSPFLNVFRHHHPLQITLDSRAETNMIRATITTQIGAQITKTSQLALQTDGQSPLDIIGETKLLVTCDHHSFFLEVLVVQNIDGNILAGVQFMTHNDITICPATHQVILADHTTYYYGLESWTLPPCCLPHHCFPSIGPFSHHHHIAWQMP